MISSNLIKMASRLSVLLVSEPQITLDHSRVKFCYALGPQDQVMAASASFHLEDFQAVKDHVHLLTLHQHSEAGYARSFSNDSRSGSTSTTPGAAERQ